ncbi:ArsR family transcriptional regulator [Methanolobus sp. ZRKC2]|uniref:ArsR family transcriptional regulator n=1 Tax=Methanolobus sp. ZRKC2 TaxID=3125783 RepID=UPI0032502F06
MSENDNKCEDQKLKCLRLFRALDSETRLEMLQHLFEDEKHVSELARELGISVPVAAKHVNILEAANLVERNVFGKTHVLELNNKNVASSLDVLAPIKNIEVEKGTNLLDILKTVSTIETKTLRDKEHVISTNGEKGFFIYEVNGEFSDKTVQNFVVTKDSNIVWKKLEPVAKLRMNIKVKE